MRLTVHFAVPLCNLGFPGRTWLQSRQAGIELVPMERIGISSTVCPDMLASTGESIFISVPALGLMEAVAGGQFISVRGPQGGPVSDLTELDGTLFAANGSDCIFSAPEESKVWKRLPAVASQAAVRRSLRLAVISTLGLTKTAKFT